MITVEVASQEGTYVVEVDSAPGPKGASVYQVWLGAGNTGTEADFLASLIQHVSTGAEIDDTTSRSDAVYSSSQMERRLTETIGNPDIDLVLIFENQLSKEL